jgi:hypothetical protein
MRTQTERGNTFELEGEGSAMFTLYTRVITRDSAACKPSDKRVLNYPDGSATAA